MVELTTLAIARMLLVAAVLKVLRSKALVLKVTSSKSLLRAREG